MKFFYLLFVLLFFTAARSNGQEGYCPPSNVGFESGTFTNWQCDTGSVSPTGQILVKSSPPVANRQTMIDKNYSPKLDPFGQFPTLCPFGGKHSIRLGNQGTGARAERVSYTFTVAAGANQYDMIFYYAVVLQNPSHLSYEQPRFTLKTFDVTDNRYVDCAAFDFIASDTLSASGFRRAPVIAPADTQVFFKDWAPAVINLRGLAGKQVRIEFTTNDCTKGGHFGYAYLDVNEDCSPTITGNSYCSNQTSMALTAPGGFEDYAWYTPDFSKRLSGAQVYKISPPPPDGTRYAVILQPFNGIGCIDTLYTTVNKNIAKFIFKTADTIYACPGSTVDLTAPSVTAGSDNNLQLSYFADNEGLRYLYDPQNITKNGTYYIKAVDPESCMNILPVTVIFGNPVLPVNDPLPVYAPATVDISTAFVHDKHYTYKYFADSRGSVEISDYQHIAVGGTYYIEAINSAGCTTIAPVTVVINAPVPIEPGPVSGSIAVCSGTASASPNILQFNVSGNNLSGDITVAAPPVFEISLDASAGYSSGLTLKESGGLVDNTIIYVRSAASDQPGSISGSITLSSPGVANGTVAVKGFVYTSPTADPINDQSVANGQLTSAVDFTGQGNTFNWVNDNPGIGLAASGTGDISPFTAINTGTSPVTANVTVTPEVKGYAYISNYYSNNISVVSVETGDVVHTISGGAQPVGVTVSQDGGMLYVTNIGSNSVLAINTKTNSIVSNITVGAGPLGIIVSPDGANVYVSNSSDNTVSVINTATNTVATKIKVGLSPAGIIISPDGNKVYVANSIGGTISVINTTTNAIASTIALGSSPYGLSISPDGRTLYVTIPTENKVSVINTTTNRLITQISVGSGPYGLNINPDGSVAYVVNKLSNNVSVINTATNSVVATIPVGSNPIGVSVSQDNTKVFVTNQGSNSLSIIDVKNNSISRTIKVGSSPEALGSFVTSGTGCTGAPVSFKITVNPTVPVVINYSGTLSPLLTTYGTPSLPEKFDVSGTGLTVGIVVTAPAGFEVSTDGVSYSNTVTIGATGTLAATPVYIRLAATTPVNDYSGSITLTSPMATTINIPMPDSRVDPAPLTIKVDDKSKALNDVNPVLTVSYLGFVNNETQAQLTVLPVITTTAVTNSPPGLYPITADGAVAPNYTPAYVAGVLTVYPVIQASAIPNTFTPNGDGINDTWDVKFLNLYSNCTVNIYNRYGENVFSSIGYGIPWDGRYKGLPLPTGTYYYIIDLKSGIKPLSGFLALIR